MDITHKRNMTKVTLHQALAVALISGVCAGQLVIAQPTLEEPTKVDPATIEPAVSPQDKQPPENPEQGTQATTPPASLPQTPVAPTSKAGPTSTAVNDKPGSEYFLRSAEAIKNAKAISYEITYKGLGGMAQYSASLTAQVKMLRDPSMLGATNGWIVRSTGSGTQRPDSPSMEFDVAWMGTAVEFVSHTDKKVIEKRNPREAKNQAFSIGNSARLTELFAGRPFSKELLPSNDYAVLEKQTLHGVEVIPVEVMSSEKKGKSVWYFGVEDQLPRKYVSVIDNAMMSGTTEFEIRSLTLETTKPTRLTKADVRVAVPEGYSEDRPPKPAATKAAEPASATPEGKGEVNADGKVADTNGVMIEMKGDGLGKGQPEFNITPAPESDAANKVIEIPKTDEVSVVLPPIEAIVPERAVISQAPEFNLRSSAGSTVSLSSLSGNYVIIEFAGSWCVPTRESRGELEAIATHFKDRNVKILTLSVRDRYPDAVIDRFNKDNKYSYPLLIEADATARAYGVTVFPTYFVLDPTHKVIKTILGYNKDSTLAQAREAVDTAMASTPK